MRNLYSIMMENNMKNDIKETFEIIRKITNVT